MPYPKLSAALLCAAIPAHGAFAHALLQRAEPPVGGSVATAPSDVVLFYSEGVEPRFTTVEVRDAAGQRVDQGAVHTAPNDSKELIAPLKSLPPGTYRVDWHATSVDTHKTEGNFQFTVTH